MGKDEDGSIDPRYAIPDDVLRAKIREAYDDPRPSIPAKEVFANLRRHKAERMKAKNARRTPR